jgi:hypothetical protein
LSAWAAGTGRIFDPLCATTHEALSMEDR